MKSGTDRRRQTDRQTDWRTDILTTREAFASKKITTEFVLWHVDSFLFFVFFISWGGVSALMENFIFFKPSLSKCLLIGYKLRCVKVKVVIGFSIRKNRSMLIWGKYCWCDSWVIKNICIFQHNKWFSVMLLLQVIIAQRDVIEARSPFLRVENLGFWKLQERKEDGGKKNGYLMFTNKI